MRSDATQRALARSRASSRMPSASTPMWGAQMRRIRSGVSSNGSSSRSTIDVVVAERLPLLEPQGAALYGTASRQPRVKIGAATVRCARGPVHVDQLARRPACASRSAGGGRSCACAALLGVARSPRQGARSKPSALRAVREAPRSMRALAPPRARPPQASRPPARRSGVQRLALHRQPEQQRRMAVSAVHSCDRRPRRGGSGPSPAARARAPSACGRRDRFRCAPGACRAAGVQRLGPLCGEPCSSRARSSGGGGGAQIEVGQRGPQVEAGAADHDRRAARTSSASSISAWASSV